MLHFLLTLLIQPTFSYLITLADRQAILSPVQTTLAAFPTLPTGLDLLQTSTEEIGTFLKNGSLSSVDLVKAYLFNIEKNNHQGLNLRAVIQAAPLRGDVINIAARLDEERQAGTVRSPLHGIPILVKDNIATEPELGMNTSAGNFAFKESVVKEDAEVIRKLRDAGAIIIAKTNLNEFAGWKGILEFWDEGIPNGWSAVGGQTSSAYVEGGFAAGGDPLGSSSGSAVGVSAGFGAAALGTDTGGSVISPASRAALYAMRPTTGLVSVTGVVPISKDLDTVGPMGFTTRGIAILLDALTFSDGRLPLLAASPEVEKTLKATAETLAEKAGAEVIDVNMDLSTGDLDDIDTAIMTIMETSAREDMEEYMGRLEKSPVRTLRELIEWNEAHAELELPPGTCCQQRLLDSLLSPGRDSTRYAEAWETVQRLGRDRGLGHLFDRHNLDALVFSPDLGFVTAMTAALGYVEGTAPMGYCENGAPFGILFITKPGEEKKLLGILAGYEEIMPKRKIPGPVARVAK
ncbi:amidase signature domain-containing protein [Dioszegia hungarica]|uniref:Amidase signature domain-containing protein n=1 Tax=Dioszegia hungarica TaxID=4972 RepID=A0AA38H6Q6_9TREE|nr:amidase signature domain-containing protein [Dioszegia hungarica]KAI9635123.1 amidase signature domain-containing protein [Dioszegia hungarica]